MMIEINMYLVDISFQMSLDFQFLSFSAKLSALVLNFIEIMVLITSKVFMTNLLSKRDSIRS